MWCGVNRGWLTVCVDSQRVPIVFPNLRVVLGDVCAKSDLIRQRTTDFLYPGISTSGYFAVLDETLPTGRLLVYYTVVDICHEVSISHNSRTV